VAWVVAALAAWAAFETVIHNTGAWDSHRTQSRHFRMIVALVAVALVAGVTGGIVRYNVDGPARQAAAARQAASPQGRYDAAVSAAQRAFEAQGFQMSSDTSPPLVLRPDLASGEMYVVTWISTGWVETHLLIRKVNRVWIAGCATRVPGVMYPLGANNNKLASTVAITGQCPAGLDPPSPAPAGTG
jgi:hypothetical protein